MGINSEKLNADTAVTGLSDISGVKTNHGGSPERTVSRAAGGENSSGCPSDTAPSAGELAGSGVPATDGDSLQDDSDCGDKLDAEFEALIRGPYKDAFRRRTEGIIRKRLRSAKSRATTAGPVTGTESAAPSEHPSTAKDGGDSSAPLPPDNGRERLQLLQNSNRPTENGIGGSVGMYSRVDVSSLTGRDVRDILKRASLGEKIRFDR